MDFENARSASHRTISMHAVKEKGYRCPADSTWPLLPQTTQKDGLGLESASFVSPVRIGKKHYIRPQRCKLPKVFSVIRENFHSEPSAESILQSVPGASP